MPMGAVQLKPGVDVIKTLSANEAGVSISQLIRYKEGIIQTYGGWQPYVSFTIPSTVREMHAWQDAAGTKHLGIGATQNLMVITAGSNQDITPQTSTTNFTPNFSVSSGSNVVTIVDTNSSGLASVYNTVFFNTPVALAGMLLNGAYKINTITSSNTYTILASVSTATVSSSGILPFFQTSSGSGIVTGVLPNNNFPTTIGLFESFYAPTSVGGLTIQGPYQIQTTIDSTSFTFNSPTQATSASSVTMNAGKAQLVYYVTVGPQITGSGFGSGGFGSGGFGSGTTTTGVQGTPITAIDWSMDNWGEILLACPSNGPVYTWSPDSGFQNAQVITQAPFFNGGLFVSQPQQILVLWKSCLSTGTQDNLVIRWSNALDYTNWTVSNQTTAGSFHFPRGSVIQGAIQTPTQAVIWTDIDAWVMQYVGGIIVFNFTQVGAGCGLVGQHAAGTLAGAVWWMGYNNFYTLSSSGVQVLQSSVWDFVFQNINTANITKVRCATNSAFNEIAWLFPSALATENDSYAKFNILEQEWDSGALNRTAWIDVSVLGNPIATDTSGAIYQHETGNATTGASAPTFRSGWWAISEGNDLAFVDFVIPDFIWGTYSGPKTSPIMLTFYSVNYPGDTPISYGPYTVTQSTEFISPRIRGRLMSVLIQGDGLTFWRLGKIRFRFAISGRR